MWNQSGYWSARPRKMQRSIHTVGSVRHEAFVFVAETAVKIVC